MNTKLDELKNVERLIKEKEYNKLMSVINQNEDKNIVGLQQYNIKKI